MPNPYEKLKKQTQDKIDKAKKELSDAEDELETARKETVVQELKQKKEPKKYDAKKHEAAKKKVILLTGDCKRFKRAIGLLEEQLENFQDGFEEYEERQKKEENVKEHAKAVFFEVEKFALKVGDTTKKLKTAFEQCQKLQEVKFNALESANKELGLLDQTTQPGEFKKAQTKVNTLTSEVALLGKKLEVLKERYEYYEEEKKKFKQMLGDGDIDEKEYKYYKEALKREMR